MGFFAEAGPLQVFVSNHLIPEGFSFDTTHEPCYQAPDVDSKLMAGSEVRLRIVGTRVDASDIVSRGCVGAGGACECRGGARRSCAAALIVNYTCTFRPVQFAVGSINEDYLGVIREPL